MSEQRFPFRRLPDDLRLKILKTMDYREMAGYSLVSKKAHSMVKSLRVPTSSCKIEISESAKIKLARNDHEFICFNFILPENNDEPTSLSDLPVSVEIFRCTIDEYLHFTCSNQGWSVEQWLQRLSSIFQHEKQIAIKFYIGEARLAVESFRNISARIKDIDMIYRNVEDEDEPDDRDILYAEKVLRVFLPVVEDVSMDCVPLRENFSLQHIGMTNLKSLVLESDHNLKFDDLLTLNVESFMIDKTENISLRDLNRFFKLWMKGSFPKLKYVSIGDITITTPDWTILLKGLKAEESEERRRACRRFRIYNCRGVCGEIFIQYDRDRVCYVGFSDLRKKRLLNPE